MKYGDETVLLLEIDQPHCTRTYGSAPCAAALSAGSPNKCYNTRATCQDTANYLPETRTIRFVRSQDEMIQYGPAFPGLEGISFTPGSINLGGMDRNKSPFGTRASITATLSDGLHSDLLMDDYRLERETGAASFNALTYVPYRRGTFWTKWLARNPFHAAYACRAYIGKVGDPISSMRVQNYIIERIDGPDEGVVTLTAKDIFSLIERRKSVAPLASRGSLLNNITSVAASATLNPAGIGNLEYPTSGYVCVGQEIIQFTRAGDVLTLVARGAANTVAAAHSLDDLVQLVLVFTAQRAHEIVYSLVGEFTRVPLSRINKPAWDVQAAGLLDQYTAYITEPTPVADLIGELSEQAGFTTYPEISTGMMEFFALRSQAPAYVVTDNEWIVAGSLSAKRLDRVRASQVHVYFGQVDPTKKIDERRNYASRLVSIDTEAEGPTKFGTPAIREVFSRWIPRFGGSQARPVADRLLTMFLNPPVEAKFRMSALQTGTLKLARIFSLKVAEFVGFDGSPSEVAHVPIEITDGESEIDVKSQEVSFSVQPAAGATTDVHLDSISNNVNMRAVWDLLYPTPVSGQQIKFVIDPAITIGSSSISLFSLDTGDWPAGVLLTLENKGYVQGKGGVGGRGGDASTGRVGSNGEGGGTALKVRFALTIINAAGNIWGGAGGGGGGSYVGGGGAGGAGADIGAGGAGGVDIFPGQNGGDGTATAGGAGGIGGSDGGTFGGFGGNGGGPGAPGSAGGFFGGGAPGAGGSAGKYIEGIAFVTWTSHGSELGLVS